MTPNAALFARLQHGRGPGSPDGRYQSPGPSAPRHRHKIGFIGKPSASDRAAFLSNRGNGRCHLLARTPKRQEISMFRLASAAPLIPLVLACWAGTAQAGTPRIAYTH